jgi:Helicase C-terminal domain
LFVAGRFDGMDFLADECRLVIVTTLPRAVNLQEEFLTTSLRDAAFMRRRLNQRIVQALGRCNRSAGDFGVYLLADRRFATHFGPESNKKGIPGNIIAELDMAQDAAEIEVGKLVKQVEAFMRGEFEEYDRALETYRADLRAVPVLPGIAPAAVVEAEAEFADKEVLGWTALFESLYYEIAAHNFEACWEAAKGANLLEMGGFHGWNWAKALYLESLRGEPAARGKALQVMEDALNRGGRSPWFNRLRASLNRERHAGTEASQLPSHVYAASLFQCFDDLLERLDTRGNRFERWCRNLTEQLSASKHSTYQEGLVSLGELLGYQASRPVYSASTDCRWRGVFGNVREVFTFEAKIEHAASQQITASDMGQAHNQFARAVSEYQSQGYTIRGTIVTHLTSLAPGVASSAGGIKIVGKEAVLELWHKVHTLLALYREQWSLEDIAAREASAQRIRSRIPEAGWQVRALETHEEVITSERLCREWR